MKPNQGEVVFDFKTKARLRSRFPCLIIRVKVVLDLGFVGPYVLMINQRVRSWPGGTRVTSSNVTYRTMKSLRGQMLGYGVGRSSLQGVEDLTGQV